MKLLKQNFNSINVVPDILFERRENMILFGNLLSSPDHFLQSFLEIQTKFRVKCSEYRWAK